LFYPFELPSYIVHMLQAFYCMLMEPSNNISIVFVYIFRKNEDVHIFFSLDIKMAYISQSNILIL
jgi:hypothetical protein